MKQIIYTIYRPQRYIKKTKIFGHFVYKNKKKTIIAPLEFHKDSINPKNFLKLKTTIKIKKILIHDRTNPCFKKTLIVGHVNRSGFNFFIGSKTTKELPMFPDMSNIYKSIKGMGRINVHTVGPERFKKEPLVNQITSEYIGLVAPLWHYVGVDVFGEAV